MIVYLELSKRRRHDEKPGKNAKGFKRVRGIVESPPRLETWTTNLGGDSTIQIGRAHV